jgi:hypothetical protein
MIGQFPLGWPIAMIFRSGRNCGTENLPKTNPILAGFEQWLSAGMDKTRLSMSPH